MDILDQFHAYILLYKRVSFNTYLAYKKDAEDFLTYLGHQDIRIADAQALHYITFLKTLEHKKLSRSTATRKVAALKMLARYLHEKCEMNDVSNEIKIDSRLPVMIGQEAVDKKLHELRKKKHTYNDARSYVMLYLLYVSRIEVNQLVRLQQNDLDQEKGLLRIRKTDHKARYISLPLDIHQMLSEYIKQIPFESAFLFPVKLGFAIRPISKQAVWSLLKSLFSQKQSISGLIEKQTLTHESLQLKELYSKIHPRK